LIILDNESALIHDVLLTFLNGIASRSRQFFWIGFVLLAKIYDKVFYNGYLAACELAVQDIVARYARGNVLVQDRRFMSELERLALQKAADKAAKRLAIRIGCKKR
jgi:hypothetical protein